MEMVIPLSLGYLFAKERDRYTAASGWRDRLLRWGTPEASRALLIFFGGLIMVAALLFTGSRAGLFSFLGSMLVMALLLFTRRAGGKRRWGLLAAFVALGFAFALWLNAGKVMKTFAILWVGRGISRPRLGSSSDGIRCASAWTTLGPGPVSTPFPGPFCCTSGHSGNSFSIPTRRMITYRPLRRGGYYW